MPEVLEPAQTEPEQARAFPERLNIDRERVKVLYVQGHSVTALAKLFKISPNSIANWVRRYKWSDLRDSPELKQAKAELQANKAKSDSVKAKLESELDVTITALSKTKPVNKLEHLSSRSKTLTGLVDSACKLFGWNNQTLSSFGLVMLERPEQMVAIPEQSLVVSNPQPVVECSAQVLPETPQVQQEPKPE